MDNTARDSVENKHQELLKVLEKQCHPDKQYILNLDDLDLLQSEDGYEEDSQNG